MAAATLERRGEGLTLRLAGEWLVSTPRPSLESILPHGDDAASGRQTLRFDGSELGEWDSTLLTFVARLEAVAAQRGLTIDRSGLPSGAQRLLELAEAVPERGGARTSGDDTSFLERVGRNALSRGEAARDMLAFVGDATLSVGRLLRRRARFRSSDLALFLQQAGAEALPIVTLISFLVGMILAFVGAVQLEQFGASIYVANLVGIAIVREMGAMMTAIVMAGRTGAAYAAQLGSMKVTQEIDALRTMGIAPFDFLVLPRMLALVIMLPMLCLYANVVGILGGAVVGVMLLDLSPFAYFQQTNGAIRIGDLVGGVGKASVYGLLIALAGCLRGMQCGSSSSAVGDATTAAVVTSIVAIIGACGVFAVAFYILGI